MLFWKVKLWLFNIFSVADIIVGLLLTPPLLFIILPLGSPFCVTIFRVKISEAWIFGHPTFQLITLTDLLWLLLGLRYFHLSLQCLPSDIIQVEPFPQFCQTSKLKFDPGSDRWTPARGDTTASIGVSVVIWSVFSRILVVECRVISQLSKLSLLHISSLLISWSFRWLWECNSLTSFPFTWVSCVTGCKRHHNHLQCQDLEHKNDF